MYTKESVEETKARDQHCAKFATDKDVYENIIDAFPVEELATDPMMISRMAPNVCMTMMTLLTSPMLLSSTRLGK